MRKTNLFEIYMFILIQHDVLLIQMFHCSVRQNSSSLFYTYVTKNINQNVHEIKRKTLRIVKSLNK